MHLAKAPVHARAEQEFHRGLSLHESGLPEQAVAAFASALQHHPKHVGSLVALGHCLLDGRHPTSIVDMLDNALRDHPGDVRILVLQGRALLAAGRVDAAIRALSLALAVEPGNAAAHTGLANALAAHGQAEQGLRHSMVAFHLVADHAHASNFSAFLIATGYFEEALNLAGYALRRRPDHYGALINRAAALDGLGRMDDAIVAAEQAVAAAPAPVDGHLLLAGLYLRLGRMTPRAWDLYEARHRIEAHLPAWQKGPVWTGGDLTGLTILLHAEQGFGDTLQFVRYAPLVAKQAGRVVLAVQPGLVRLLQGTPGVDLVMCMDEPLPAFDLVCPLLSLPLRFATTLQTIPPALAYAGEVPVGEPARGCLKVGIVWAGNPGFPLDRQRSIPAAMLGVLAGIEGVQFFSLQSPRLPSGLDAIDLMANVHDFADTAQAVAGLDLVVSVDTAVAHLAATMGKPVWLLSRFRGCWRWLQHRDDSPWYPGMRILRQTRPADWSGVLALLRQDLTALAASRHQA